LNVDIEKHGFTQQADFVDLENKNIFRFLCSIVYMESITEAAEYILIDSLSFQLPGSGQYIQESRSVSFQTEGSNSYLPSSGTRVL
jgi:hypothetical protein